MSGANREVIDAWICLAFLLAVLTSLVDLLQSFTIYTLKRALAWTAAYLLMSGALASLIHVLLLQIDVNVGGSAAPPWLKPVVAGLAFQPLLQSRLFTVKTQQLGEFSVGPAATYQKITDLIKRQISMAGMPGNVAFLQDYMGMEVDQLRNRVITVVWAHEMWDEDQKRTQIRDLDNDLQQLKDEDAKRLLLAWSLLKFGAPDLQILERYRKKLENLDGDKLRNVTASLVPHIGDTRTRNYVKAQVNEDKVEPSTLRSILTAYSPKEFMKGVIEEN